MYTKRDVKAVLALYRATYETAELMTSGVKDFPRRSPAEIDLINRGQEIVNHVNLVSLELNAHPNALQAARESCDGETLTVDGFVYGLKHKA